MSTTTIRLPEDLKARIDTLAAEAGDSAHAFMVKTLDEATERLARRSEFHAEAERRLQHMAQTGEYLTIEDLRAYAKELVRGESPQKPVPRRMSAQERQRFSESLRRAR